MYYISSDLFYPFIVCHKWNENYLKNKNIGQLQDGSDR